MLRSRRDLVRRGDFPRAKLAEADVVLDGVVEQDAVLRDDADVQPHASLRASLDVLTSYTYNTTLYVVKAVDEFAYRTFSSAGSSDERHLCAGLDDERYAIENKPLVRIIRKSNVLKLHSGVSFRFKNEHFRILQVFHFLVFSEKFEH